MQRRPVSNDRVRSSVKSGAIGIVSHLTIAEGSARQDANILIITDKVGAFNLIIFFIVEEFKNASYGAS